MTNKIEPGKDLTICAEGKKRSKTKVVVANPNLLTVHEGLSRNGLAFIVHRHKDTSMPAGTYAYEFIDQQGERIVEAINVIVDDTTITGAFTDWEE